MIKAENRVTVLRQRVLGAIESEFNEVQDADNGWSKRLEMAIEINRLYSS